MRYFNLIIFLIFFNCNRATDEKFYNADHYLISNLELIKNRNILFKPNLVQQRSISFIERMPHYYNFKKNYYDYGNKDSIIISTLSMNYEKFYYQAYKKGFISKKEFLKKDIDTALARKRPSPITLDVLVEFRNGKQILTPNLNFDDNFLDDIKIEFNDNFRINASNEKIKSELPLLKFKYWYSHEGEIDTLTRSIRIFPSLNDFRFSFTENENSKKSRLITELRDYWKGEIQLGNERMDIAVQGFSRNYLEIFVKPSNKNFSNKDFIYNENYRYSLKDTFLIQEQSFLIDSISNDISKIYFKKLDKKKVYGFRESEKIKNYDLQNLNDNIISLYNYLEEGKLTILNFWGTWCRPCVKEIPDLKKIQEVYKNNIKLLSVAYDGNLDKVKTYVDENNMKWTHFFHNRKMRNGIIKDLEVKYYPTTFLINAKGKIIYRGSGEQALDEIRRILKHRLHEAE